MVVACYEKPWLRRGSKWLLIVACAALVGMVLFALISSLADGPAPDHGVTVPLWARWEVVCLGVGGGLDQSDLPGGFLLRAIGTPSIFFHPESGGGASSVTYVSLDAGTALFGLQRALQSSRAPRRASPSAGPKLTAAGAVYRDSVQSYLISHGHLDHTAGLVVGSPDDAYTTPRKVVAGTNYTIDTLQNHVFNWKVWPNMGSGGDAPIGLYNLVTLPVGQESNLTAPPLGVRPFLLSHGKMGDGSTYFSTAFLLRVWIHVAPIVAAGRLKALFLECSYGDDRASDKLYGHLNPQLFMQELGVLARLVEAQPGARPGGLLKGLKVVVTHIKADDLIYRKPVPAVATIQRELEARNTLEVHLLFPRQGDWLYF
ncbi:cyclicAMP phosphodiesterase [Acanthamoeba castellanii str. Neff]|uniref:CyclicAMP phosphodiesterase n=1 Tax=Acanthamoeba castellanii (strain ATCC 30010 / Neff) TaxID=1257118 RepID=L8HFI5_ACACF|nr:cyclicAMP phosphodiesterase [Acanthamoeba castellanii str. Neff]ELR24007.1 cyclicAMP phosphodiesterase [Acanthamoeba castellanii str. Neff]